MSEVEQPPQRGSELALIARGGCMSEQRKMVVVARSPRGRGGRGRLVRLSKTVKVVVVLWVVRAEQRSGGPRSGVGPAGATPDAMCAGVCSLEKSR